MEFLEAFGPLVGEFIDVVRKESDFVVVPSRRREDTVEEKVTTIDVSGSRLPPGAVFDCRPATQEAVRQSIAVAPPNVRALYTKCRVTKFKLNGGVGNLVESSSTTTEYDVACFLEAMTESGVKCGT